MAHAQEVLKLHRLANASYIANGGLAKQAETASILMDMATQLRAAQDIIAQMDAEQSQNSGVSLDEEMTNMIKFENSYKASAKYISTISQMMEILMSLGG